ncbi:MAG: gliding motility-associated peptidyl-prolyl isomerase GldI [Psychroflexus sp.]|nr:gliding motility-associated peptidyl-prolyl isomerase GldI [Psychroflexus sp.]MDN6310228.1 gliding motility-associated peptidyl-prolyl isomerase GldI [Psychroflexus sp.]
MNFRAKTILSFVFASLLLWSCKTPEPRKPVSSRSDTFIQKSIKRNKAIVKDQEKLIKKIVEADSSQQYHTSKNGFWYTYNTAHTEDSITPKVGDEVEFNYNILSLKNDTIYSSSELGERAVIIDKEDIFSGLRQGLKLMKVNETVTFYFPSHKAYGYYGDQQKIGKNVPIKSIVTLNKITKDDTSNN